MLGISTQNIQTRHEDKVRNDFSQQQSTMGYQKGSFSMEGLSVFTDTREATFYKKIITHTSYIDCSWAKKCKSWME